IKASVMQAKEQGLTLPFLMNCSGYETVEMIRSMDGLIDIFLPDFKYMSPLLAKKYSHASDYPAVAKKALAEMVRQQPKAVFDKNGMMQKGVIVRHLLLPGCTEDSKRVLAYLYQTYKDSIYISIMSQFTPLGLKEYPELDRCVSETEYEELIDFAQKLGVTRAYIQEGSAASESFIPAFDCEGV
ncbi:MAG: radical SAM protein, partial [Clostridia bacterium]|nr:radical SAM protein [Clostridia bacterium]